MAKQVETPIVAPEPITISEYIRRKHALMLETDELAKPVDRGTIDRAVKRGDIVLIKQVTMSFIDWNVYKHFIFRQYGQMPVKKAKANV